MHCLVFNFIAIFTLHNTGFRYSSKQFTLPGSIYHKNSFPPKTHLPEGKNNFPTTTPTPSHGFFVVAKINPSNPSACLSRMSFVNWLCSIPSSLPRFNSSTVECVLDWSWERKKWRKLGSATLFLRNNAGCEKST